MQTHSNKRHFSNWIKGYGEYVGLMKHEAPQCYHLWVALSMVAASLERKVWFQLVNDRLFANMFVILVGPPGECRKSSAIKIGVKLLKEMQDKINISSERLNLAVLIKDLAASRTVFEGNSVLYTHSSMTAISAELSVFLRVTDPEFIPTLCDFYDCGDTWENKTIYRGTEEIINLWLNIIAATVPPGFTNSLPREVISSGFSARSIFVFANTKGCINIQEVIDPQIAKLRAMLVHDLGIIYRLYGKYKLTPDASTNLSEWYNVHCKDKSRYNLPEYGLTFHSRKHAHILKVAMIIAAARRDELIITKEDIGQAYECIEAVRSSMHYVFGAVGRSPTAIDVAEVSEEIRTAGEIPRWQLLSRNCANMDAARLYEVIKTLQQMNKVVVLYKEPDVVYRWIGR